MIFLMCLFQQSKDVEEKLRDLDLWVNKLENTVVTASSDIDPEEAAGRERFTRLALLLYGPVALR